VKASTPAQRVQSRARKAVAALHDCFRGEDLSIRAAALTYLTAFSLVPLLTVVLGLLAALHQQAFHDRVHGFIQDVLSPAMGTDSSAVLEHFVSIASSRAVRGIGFLTLAYSAGSLLHHLEFALNAVWDVRQRRPLLMRVGFYVGALLLGPVLLAVSLAGTEGLRQVLLGIHTPLAIALVRWVSVAAAALALTLLYVLGPNARVDLRAALAGGIVAALGWELAKRGYAEFATRIFRYNAIYGSLGAIPLFLLWIYVSWIVVLFGARLAFALQRAVGYETVRWFEHHPMGDALVALVVAVELGRAERAGLAPIGRQELMRRIELPDLLCSRGIDRLITAGLARGTDRVALTRGLESIVATDLFRSESPPPAPPGLPKAILAVAHQLEGAARNHLDGLRLTTLLEAVQEPDTGKAVAIVARKA
jgi:membrane protein